MSVPKIIFSFFVLFASSLTAREASWQLTLTNGDTISNVMLLRLDGDSLVVTDAQSSERIDVGSIFQMQKVKKSKFWKGAGIGFVAGGIAGALIASDQWR